MAIGKYFDCGVAIMSRQYERDRDTVVKRAKNCDVSGMLCWFADIEKQSELAEYCKSNSGLCYFATGILPDNVDRTNKKQDEILLSKIQSIACRSECVGITSGLNLSRDIGSHYAQELLLFGCYYLAYKCGLPLILHCNNDGISMEKTVELLQGTQLQEYLSLKQASDGGSTSTNTSAESGYGAVNIIFHDVIGACNNDSSVLQKAVDIGCYFIVSSLDCGSSNSTNNTNTSNTTAMLHSIPQSKLLVASNSPWSTPQCIPDKHMRTSKNEPSNMEYMVQQLWAYQHKNQGEDGSIDSGSSIDTDADKGAVVGVGGGFDTIEALTRAVYTNALNVYGLIPSAVAGGGDNTKERSDSIGESKSRSGSVGRSRSGSVGRSRSGSMTNNNNSKTGEKPHADANSTSTHSEPEPDTNDNASTDAGTDASLPVSPKVSYYSCKRCRSKLFNADQLSVHPPANAPPDTDTDTDRGIDSLSVFNTTYMSICKSIHFLEFYVSNTMLAGANPKKDVLKSKETRCKFPHIIHVPPKEVKCSECNVKFGQYFEYDSKCLCGVSITGPGVKVS